MLRALGGTGGAPLVGPGFGGSRRCSSRARCSNLPGPAVAVSRARCNKHPGAGGAGEDQHARTGSPLVCPIPDRPDVWMLRRSCYFLVILRLMDRVAASLTPLRSHTLRTDTWDFTGSPLRALTATLAFFRWQAEDPRIIKAS